MAATQPILHADQYELSALVGMTLARANAMGLLVDADVGAGKTIDTMKAAVETNAAPLHSEFQGYVDRTQRGLDYGATLGILSTANIQGVTTLEELIAICNVSSSKVGGPLPLE